MKRHPNPAIKQPTSQELLDALCEFIRRKFYPEHAVSFCKDRPRLLKWVVLYPAGWFNSRGVTVTPERYKAILEDILINALRFSEPSKVTYLPAYLRQVVQSHFRIHGEDYYAAAKAVRNLVEHAVIVAGHARVQALDPVRELATAARLLRVKKAPRKQAVNNQLTLL